MGANVDRNMGLKETLAGMQSSLEISRKIFANSVLKDEKGEVVSRPQLDTTYLLYSKESDKCVGWIKTPKDKMSAGTGWCKLPSFVRMQKPPEDMPYGLTVGYFAEVPLDEYGLTVAVVPHGDPIFVGSPEAKERMRRLDELMANTNVMVLEDMNEGLGV